METDTLLFIGKVIIGLTFIVWIIRVMIKERKNESN